MKTYCLDTSVFIDNPKILEHLGESEIIIPFCVLSELDNNRKKPGFVGKNAREAIRNIDRIDYEEIHRGGVTESGGIVRFVSTDFDVPTNDLKIIACAEYVRNQDITDVILLSNDIGLRVHASAKGITAKGFKKEGDKFVYSGNGTLILDADLIDHLHKTHYLEIPIEDDIIQDTRFYQNQMIIITGIEQTASTLARVQIENDTLCFYKIQVKHPWGVVPGSVEQIFAVDLLTNPDIDLVSLVGKAGCGKTFLATAAGLDQVIEKRMYEKIILLRPIVPMGKDIGYLPGTMEEKLAPWIQPIKDNLEVLFNGDRKTMDMMFDRGQIVVEAMSYIRGRSIPKSFIIVDECQNLSLDQLKTVLTRAAEGSKIVLTGDIEQIDNSSIDVYSNGLSRVVEAFKDEEIAGHMTLVKGQRSKLATIAAEIL